MLIGGYALAIYGGDSVTTDIDLAIDRDPQNLDRAALAIRDLNPTLANGAPMPMDRFSFAGEFTRFYTDAGEIDVLRRLNNVDGFAGLRSRAVCFDLFGVTVPVASLPDLRAMKVDVPRPKDMIHVLEIDALIEELEIESG